MPKRILDVQAFEAPGLDNGEKRNPAIQLSLISGLWPLYTPLWPSIHVHIYMYIYMYTYRA